MDGSDWLVAGLLVLAGGMEAWAILYLVREWPSLWGFLKRGEPQTIELETAGSSAMVGNLGLRKDYAQADTIGGKIERLEKMLEAERVERTRQDDAIRADMLIAEGRIRDHVMSETSRVSKRLEGTLSLDRTRAKRAASLIILGIVVGIVANLISLAC